MPDFVAVAPLADVPADGRVRCFDAPGGRRVALSRWKGSVVATSPSCPHALAPLDDEGEVEEGKLICFRHGWAFDVRTGACDADPEVRLDVFPAMVQDGIVHVALP